MQIRKKSNGTHWVSLSADRNTAVYFDSLGVEYIPQEELSQIKDKSITNNIFSIQNNDSTMCVSPSIASIEYMIARKNLLDYTNSFSPNDYKKKNKMHVL